MKKIKVTEKSGASIEYISDGEILNRLHLMGHGLPERPELDAEGNPTGNTFPAEYTVEIVDITAELEQEKINTESLAYLASTDWMIIREIDSGVVCPADVKLARAEARAKIVRNN
jgi:hypothetical protein